MAGSRNRVFTQDPRLANSTPKNPVSKGSRREPGPIYDLGITPGGYQRRSYADYDRALCLLPQDVYDFILATQPRAWKRLQQHHGAQTPTDAAGYLGRDGDRAEALIGCDNANKCRPLSGAPWGSLLGSIGENDPLFHTGNQLIGELLVAIMNNQRDIAIAREKGWYRIPVRSAQKWLKDRWPPQWLAFYQTKEFASERYTIRDFAIKCAAGQIDVETDGDSWHANPQQADADNLRDNALKVAGWTVLRFNSKRIREQASTYCLSTVSEKINKLGGLDEGGWVPRKIDPEPPNLP